MSILEKMDTRLRGMTFKWENVKALFEKQGYFAAYVVCTHSGKLVQRAD
jgi:hypothetical protein